METERQTCYQCFGKGFVRCYPCEDFQEQLVCLFTGKYEIEKCQKCNGLGSVAQAVMAPVDRGTSEIEWQAPNLRLVLADFVETVESAPHLRVLER